MAKPEWGLKRTCTSCGAKFYDLRRDPIICPKCDAVVDPAATSKSQRSKAPAVKEAPPKPEKKAVAEDDDLVVVDDDSLDDVDVEVEDDDNAAIEDASELGEDKDDMFGVIDTGSDEGEETR